MLSSIHDLVVEPSNPFYVYAHYRLSDGQLFYIGKGKNKRAWTKNKRNNYWNNVVNKHGFYVSLLAQDLTEEDAYVLEKQVIELFKTMYCPLTNLTAGGVGGKGYVASEETRKKMSIARKGKPRPKHVVDVVANANSREFIIVEPSGNTVKGFNLTKFCRENNLDVRNIHAVIKGKDKSYKGWTQYKGEQ